MISIYKPQKNSNGCAASFYISQYGCVMMNLIQQYSWNETTRNGSFSENKDNKDKTASIKLNMFECGEIVRSISNYKEWKAYHSFKDNKTKLALTTWSKGESPMFGLSVDQNGKQFKLPVSLGEAECIKILMQEFIKQECTKTKES